MTWDVCGLCLVARVYGRRDENTRFRCPCRRWRDVLYAAARLLFGCPMTVLPPPQAVSALPDNPLSLSSSVRMQITGCPDTPALVEAPKKEHSAAEWMYQRLAQAIAAFEKGLDDEHEVAFNLVSGGGGQLMHADNLGFWAPDLLVFMGRNEQGLPVQLFQHYSQVNLTLAAAKKQAPEAPKRIGFEIMRSVERAATP